MLPCLKGGETASNGGYDWQASRTRIKDQLFGVSTGPFWSALFADCVLLLIVITYRCVIIYPLHGGEGTLPPAKAHELMGLPQRVQTRPSLISSEVAESRHETAVGPTLGKQQRWD